MKIVLLFLALLHCSFSFAQTAAEELSPLQRLGLLLGLSADTQEAPIQEQDVPTFVKNLYECWSDETATDCLPGYQGSEVNLIRTSLGTEYKMPSKALHAFNTNRELTNTLPISFNISVTAGQTDITHYAMLRLHRSPLPSDSVSHLQQDCSGLSDASLQLYTLTGAKAGTPVFTLMASKPLVGVELAEEEWVEFSGLTALYQEVMDSLHQKVPSRNLKIAGMLHTMLAVQSPSCPTLSPSDLGFGSGSENRAQLLGFEENTVQNDLVFSDVMSQIAKKHGKTRSRRQAPVEVATMPPPTAQPTEGTPSEASGSTTMSPESASSTATSTAAPLPTLPTGAPTPSHVDNYPLKRCQLYHLEVSFADLGYQSVLHPATFTTNFCAGHCQWPASQSHHGSKHAIIQAYASFKNEDIIPAPCCVPQPGTLKMVTALVVTDSEQFETKQYRDLIATSCQCL